MLEPWHLLVAYFVSGATVGSLITLVVFGVLQDRLDRENRAKERENRAVLREIDELAARIRGGWGNDRTGH